MNAENIGTTKKGIYIIENNSTKFAENVPEFCGGETIGVYAGGDHSFIVCINNASTEDLNEYIVKLENEGYKRCFSNTIENNIFYSYQNGKNIIYVYRIDTLNSVKLIAEPYYSFAYSENEKNTATPAIITSSVCDRNYYIHLPDNRLVIIDGGWRIEDWSRYEPYELINGMYEEMKEICGSEKEVIVPLWILTHAHTDHCRVLEYLYRMPFADSIKIERILFNFPDESNLCETEKIPDEKLEEERNNFRCWHEKAGKDYPYEDIFYNCPFTVYDTYRYDRICRNAINNYSAVKIKAHSGMKFSFSGMDFEVLHTPDDDMPSVYTNQNDASLVIKNSYCGSTILWLGDMGVLPGNSCMQMYPNYIKCDAVQVSHHGWGSASKEFFELQEPKILFWNNSEFGFRYADKNQGYGKTESSTILYNMPSVKKNYFCNTIKMQYVDLPFSIKEKGIEICENVLIPSSTSDSTFIIRLKNGKLIIINGGCRREMQNRYGKAALAKEFYEELKRISGTETVFVVAWLLTDMNPDNNCFLSEFCAQEYNDRIKIENCIYNFPDTDLFDFNADKAEILSFRDEICSLNSNHIIPENGAKIEFEDFSIKPIYTPKGKKFTSLRDATTVYVIDILDKKIIFTGNMNDRISREIINYDKELKCDIVQIANHGYDDGGVLEFYKRCNADYNIWNCSEYAYRFFSPDMGYGKTEVSTEIYNSVKSQNNYFCNKITPNIIVLSKGDN